MIQKVINGDNVEVMKAFPDNCVDLTITSPPYEKLRNYNGFEFDFKNTIKELYRVTKKGGVVVWVVGDQVKNGSESGESFKHALFFIECGFNMHDTMIYEKNGASFPARKEGNRYTQIFEYMFVFSKGKPKNAKLICDKENRWEGYTSFGTCKERGKDGKLKERKMKPVPKHSPRNNIWRYNTGKNYSTNDNYAHEHPAIFPEKLAEDHIVSWSDEGDLVLDPMCGSGTTLKMAKLNKRNFIGIDSSEEYCKLSVKRTGLDNYEKIR